MASASYCSPHSSHVLTLSAVELHERLTYDWAGFGALTERLRGTPLPPTRGPALPTPHRWPRCVAAPPPCGARHRSAKRAIFESMHAPKIRVENGRIKLDEPTDLPNGTELYLVPAEQLDDVVLLHDDGLDDNERKRLHASIRRGIADGRAGRVTDLDEFLTELEAEP